MRILTFVVALAITVVAPDLHAWPKRQSPAAKLNKEGIKAAKAHDWETARAKFEQSYSLDPVPGTLFNLANAQERTEKFVAARASYVLYLERSKPGEDDMFRKAASAKLVELDSKIGTIRIPELVRRRHPDRARRPRARSARAQDAGARRSRRTRREGKARHRGRRAEESPGQRRRTGQCGARAAEAATATTGPAPAQGCQVAAREGGRRHTSRAAALPHRPRRGRPAVVGVVLGHHVRRHRRRGGRRRLLRAHDARTDARHARSRRDRRPLTARPRAAGR